MTVIHIAISFALNIIVNVTFIVNNEFNIDVTNCVEVIITIPIFINIFIANEIIISISDDIVLYVTIDIELHFYYHYCLCY